MNRLGAIANYIVSLPYGGFNSIGERVNVAAAFFIEKAQTLCCGVVFFSDYGVDRLFYKIICEGSHDSRSCRAAEPTESSAN